MKCLKCGKPGVDEVNLTLNRSIMFTPDDSLEDGAGVDGDEYEGTTEYADFLYGQHIVVGSWHDNPVRENGLTVREGCGLVVKSDWLGIIDLITVKAAADIFRGKIERGEHGDPQ